MAGYTRTVSAKTNFDGQEVEFSFRRLTRLEFLEVSSYLTVKDKDILVNEGKEKDFLAFLSDLIPTKLESIKGLLIDGEVKDYKKSLDTWPEFVEISKELYFQDLVKSVTQKIMEESQGPSGDVEKKPEDTLSE